MTSHPPIAPSYDPEELRIGLVLNGGVSLAVWMGGVTTEIDRLRRGEGPYGELLQALETVARVDVIAGASAGGLNGGLLATAIVHGRPMAGLDRLWVEKGAMEELFRSPFEPDPPSLMDGDGYFLPELRRALGAVAGGTSARSGGDNVHLTMVTSVINGISKGLADDFGGVIPDVSHLGTFTFVRDENVNAWDDEDALDRLALACRSSASFPFAFEPSFCPVGAKVDGRPDMAGYANFPSSRYVVDGGALMNKPFAPALDAIYAQPAGQQVRRVLLYVAPDPGTPSADQPDTPGALPGLARSVIDSVVTMPRQESVGRELADIRNHNDLVANLRRLREHLFRQAVVETASGLWPAYVLPLATSLTDSVVRRLEAGVLSQGLQEGQWKRGELRKALFKAWQGMVPPKFPSADAADPVAWLTHAAPVEGMSMTVLDLLKRGLALAPATAQEERAALRLARERVHAERAVLAAVRQVHDQLWADQGFWEQQAAETASADAEAWVAAALARWEEVRNERARSHPAIGTDVSRALSACAHRIGDVLLEVRPVLVSVAKAGARSARPGDKAAAELVRSAVKELAPGPRSRRDCVRALLAMEVSLTAFSTAAPAWDQYVELMLISGDTPNAFDPREGVAGKLTGVNLGHFAAFYMASWRANDWMFGRLDGAWRLSQMLLSPIRLRQLFSHRADDAFALIHQIATGATPGKEEPPEVGTYLVDASNNEWDPVAARQELAFLDSDEDPPPVLVHCARGVARRLQLGIVMNEVPNVAAAAESDRSAGASERSARSLRAAYVRPSSDGPLTARAAVDLFKRSDVGAETIEREIGSDLFTSTVSTASAVVVNAAGGAQLKLGPLGAIVGALKTVVMAFYVLAQSAVRPSRTAFAVMLSLLALGGLVVALPVMSDDIHPPGVLTVAGWTFLVGGVLLGWTRAGSPLSGFVLLLLTAGAFAAPLVLIDPSEGDPARGLDALLRIVRPLVAVTALIAVPWAYGAIARKARSRGAG